MEGSRVLELVSRYMVTGHQNWAKTATKVTSNESPACLTLQEFLALSSISATMLSTYCVALKIRVVR